MTTIKTLTLLLFCAAWSPVLLAQDAAHNRSVGMDAPVPVAYTLREGWFVEAGLDMTVLKPYNYPFAETFSKGRMEGVAIGIGKRFSPVISLRARINWENGLFRNKHLEWMTPLKDYPETGPYTSINYDEGGNIFSYLDVEVSMPNFLGSYNPQRRWDLGLLARGGVAHNRGQGSSSPLLGLGCSFNYKLARRTHLYADLTYQAVTSEFLHKLPHATTGMTVPTAHNGMFALHAGVQFDLGKR